MKIPQSNSEKGWWVGKKFQPRATPKTKATNSNRQISVFREGESSNSYQLSARAKRMCTISKFTTLNMESFPTLQTTLLEKTLASRPQKVHSRVKALLVLLSGETAAVCVTAAMPTS